MDAVTANDARRALALVESDPAARAVFVEVFDAAFASADDAVTVLRQTAHPDAAAEAARTRELDGLRRTAFGRTTGADEEAAAARAHAAVAEAERAHTARSAALAAAVHAVLRAPAARPDAAPAAAAVPPAPAATAPRTRHRSRMAAPLGTFLLGAALAAGGFAFATGSPVVAPVAPPAASANPGDDTLVIPGAALAESAHPGDIDAAERWLSQPQTEADLVPVGLDTIVPSSSRLAFGGASGSVWVARSVDGDLCVVASTVVDGLTASACSPPDSFLLHGAMVSVGGLVGSPGVEAVWDGAKVYVTVGSE